MQVHTSVGKFEANLTPQMVEDMNNLVDFCQHYFISKDLK
jgi:hypothetical protein